MKQYKINTGYIVQELEGSLTIFDPEQSILFNLNETASYIFNKLKKGKAVTEIVSALTKQYDASQKHLLADVDEILQTMLKNKIIY